MPEVANTSEVPIKYGIRGVNDTIGSGGVSHLDLYRRAAEQSGCRLEIVGKPGDTYDFSQFYTKEELKKWGSHPLVKGTLSAHSYIVDIIPVPGVQEGEFGSRKRFNAALTGLETRHYGEQ